MKLCWHRYTKWAKEAGMIEVYHDRYHKVKPDLESKVCVKCGKVKWRVV